jgi:Tfp pilus assembly protein PilF
VTFVTFLPILGNDFVNWDDLDNLTDNPFYRGLGWSQLRWMWTTTLMGQYIPLTWMTFGLDYLVWGMNPLGYHLTSLLLHAANAALVYSIVQRLIVVGSDEALAQDRSVRLAAACAALVFGVHPLRVESVAWATERRDVLSAFFFLASLRTYLSYVGSRSLRGYWLSLAFFAAAVLSKAMAVTLPAVLVILDLHPLSRLSSQPRTWLEPSGRRVLAEKVPFIAVGVVGSVIAVIANRGNLSALAEASLFERAVISVNGLAFYLWKTIVPLNLAALYELRIPIELSIWSSVSSAVVVGAVTSFAILGGRRWPSVGAAWLCSVILFAPVLGIVHNGPQFAADRYTYLPTLPWLALAGATLARWCAPHAVAEPGPRRPKRDSPMLSRAGGWSGRLAAKLALPTAAVGVLAALTVIQTLTWKNSERLWTHALSVAPSSLGHYNLGLVLEGQGRWDQAIDHYRAALSIKPNFPEAHYNWGVILSRQGRINEAIEHYREALRIKPDHAEAHYNWALAVSAQARDDEAIDHYKMALKLKPEFAAAHNNWGNALVRQGRWAGAVEHYEAALRIKPDYAEAHNNLASLFARQERWKDAIAHYQRALQIRPDLRSARENLDRILSRPELRGPGPRDRGLDAPQGGAGS